MPTSTIQLHSVLLFALDVVKGPYVHCAAPINPFASSDGRGSPQHLSDGAHKKPQETHSHSNGCDPQAGLHGTEPHPSSVSLNAAGPIGSAMERGNDHGRRGLVVDSAPGAVAPSAMAGPTRATDGSPPLSLLCNAEGSATTPRLPLAVAQAGGKAPDVDRGVTEPADSEPQVPPVAASATTVGRMGGFSDVFIPRSEFCRRVMWMYPAESGRLYLYFPEEIPGEHYTRKTLRYSLCFVFEVDNSFMTIGEWMIRRLIQPYSVVLTNVAEELRNAEVKYGYISRGLCANVAVPPPNAGHPNHTMQNSLVGEASGLGSRSVGYPRQDTWTPSSFTHHSSVQPTDGRTVMSSHSPMTTLSVQYVNKNMYTVLHRILPTPVDPSLDPSPPESSQLSMEAQRVPHEDADTANSNPVAVSSSHASTSLPSLEHHPIVAVDMNQCRTPPSAVGHTEPLQAPGQDLRSSWHASSSSETAPAGIVIGDDGTGSATSRRRTLNCFVTPSSTPRWTPLENLVDALYRCLLDTSTDGAKESDVYIPAHHHNSHVNIRSPIMTLAHSSSALFRATSFDDSCHSHSALLAEADSRITATKPTHSANQQCTTYFSTAQLDTEDCSKPLPLGPHEGPITDEDGGPRGGGCPHRNVVYLSDRLFFHVRRMASLEPAAHIELDHIPVPIVEVQPHALACTDLAVYQVLELVDSHRTVADIVFSLVVGTTATLKDVYRAVNRGDPPAAESPDFPDATNRSSVVAVVDAPPSIGHLRPPVKFEAPSAGSAPVSPRRHTGQAMRAEEGGSHHTAQAGRPRAVPTGSSTVMTVRLASTPPLPPASSFASGWYRGGTPSVPVPKSAGSSVPQFHVTVFTPPKEHHLCGSTPATNSHSIPSHNSRLKASCGALASSSSPVLQHYTMQQVPPTGTQALSPRAAHCVTSASAAVRLDLPASWVVTLRVVTEALCHLQNSHLIKILCPWKGCTVYTTTKALRSILKDPQHPSRREVGVYLLRVEFQTYQAKRQARCERQQQRKASQKASEVAHSAAGGSRAQLHSPQVSPSRTGTQPICVSPARQGRPPTSPQLPPSSLLGSSHSPSLPLIQAMPPTGASCCMRRRPPWELGSSAANSCRHSHFGASGASSAHSLIHSVAPTEDGRVELTLSSLHARRGPHTVPAAAGQQPEDTLEHSGTSQLDGSRLEDGEDDDSSTTSDARCSSTFEDVYEASWTRYLHVLEEPPTRECNDKASGPDAGRAPLDPLFIPTEEGVLLAASAALCALGKFAGGRSTDAVRAEMKMLPAWAEYFAGWSAPCCKALIELAILNEWLQATTTASQK